MENKLSYDSLCPNEEMQRHGFVMYPKSSWPEGEEFSSFPSLKAKAFNLWESDEPYLKKKNYWSGHQIFSNKICLWEEQNN